MPHKVRHASPYDDHTGVDRFGWGASHMQTWKTLTRLIIRFGFAFPPGAHYVAVSYGV